MASKQGNPKRSSAEIFHAMADEIVRICVFLNGGAGSGSLPWTKKYLGQWSEGRKITPIGDAVIRDVFIPAHKAVTVHHPQSTPGGVFSRMMSNVLDGEHGSETTQRRSALEFFAKVHEIVLPLAERKKSEVIETVVRHARTLASYMDSGGAFPVPEGANPELLLAVGYFLELAEKIGAETATVSFGRLFRDARKPNGAGTFKTRTPPKSFAGTLRIVLSGKGGCVASGDRGEKVKGFLAGVIDAAPNMFSTDPE